MVGIVFRELMEGKSKQMNFEKKEKYTISDLLKIVEILRAPDGCPWDREQTHESIRKNFIEETYEAVEAIDLGDPILLKEELGDVLLQVALHAQMEKECGMFDFSDVVNGICKKLIERHPHIFSDVIAKTSEEVLKNWDDIKMRTKKQQTQSEAMNSVSRALPSLMRAGKVQSKAAKVGFDFLSTKSAIEKVFEEISELQKAVERDSKEACEEELGDLLFSVVNVSRFLKLDPEQALFQASDKFIKRFQQMEQLISWEGKKISALSGQELDIYWNRAKEK
mgnify:CR=1 FL=1